MFSSPNRSCAGFVTHTPKRASLGHAAVYRAPRSCLRDCGSSDRAGLKPDQIATRPAGSRTWRTTLAAIRAIRSERPDLAISVAGRTASLVALISGARRRIGYLDEAYRWTLTDGIPGGRYQDRQHEVEYVRALARRAGVRNAPTRLHAPLESMTVDGSRIR